MRIPETEGFFNGKPVEAALFNQMEAWMKTFLGSYEMRVQKTQITFVNPRVFACISIRWRKSILLTIGLPDRIASSRVQQAVEIKPGRWTLHIKIANAAELDDELKGWICAAYAFARR